jgi:hypothetical protein
MVSKEIHQGNFHDGKPAGLRVEVLSWTADDVGDVVGQAAGMATT